MTRTILACALLASIAASSAFAAGPVELSEGNTDRIRSVLTEQGYEIGKIKIEDGLYEAYARKDEKRYEVFLDADFTIVRTVEDN